MREVDLLLEHDSAGVEARVLRLDGWDEEGCLLAGLQLEAILPKDLDVTGEEDTVTLHPNAHQLSGVLSKGNNIKVYQLKWKESTAKFSLIKLSYFNWLNNAVSSIPGRTFHCVHFMENTITHLFLSEFLLYYLLASYLQLLLYILFQSFDYTIKFAMFCKK